MSHPQSSNQEIPDASQPASLLYGPFTKDHFPKCSTHDSNPLAVSFTEDERSMYDDSAFKDIGYEYIDGAYEKMEEDAAEKLYAARSSLYWKNVWHRAVWRIVPPNSNPFTTGDEAHKAISPTQHTQGRILAAGVNIETVDQAKGPKQLEDDELPESSSSESSPSSGSLYPAEDGGLEVIHSLELDDFWTFVEATDVEDDWDMVPEADRLRKIFRQPTFNAVFRERLEKFKLEREALEHDKQGGRDT